MKEINGKSLDITSVNISVERNRDRCKSYKYSQSIFLRMR